MGNCKYCGQKAGFLKDVHVECKSKYESGWKRMIDFSMKLAKGEQDTASAYEELKNIANASYISQEKIREALVECWEKTLDQFLEDGVLSNDEENAIMKYAHDLNLKQEDLNKHGAYMRAGQAATLREIMEGRIVSRITVDGRLPFNLEKDETLVWYHEPCGYMQERVRRAFVGGTQGFSVRVAKGVYYRAGAFKGHPVETSSMEIIDGGRLGITDKHIYFAGLKKSFKVPYKKIVSFHPYDNGFGFYRNVKDAKQEVLVTNNGWFFINLVENLARL